MTGRLIAVEGVDGSGKSTQARLLAAALDAVATFQFGATDVGATIRRMLLDPANEVVDDRAEALLIIADKAQHVAEIVRPALAAGSVVVSDRFTASTLAYQGFGRGLDRTQLASMMLFATAGLEPDLNVLLDVSADIAAQRGAQRLDLALVQLPADTDGWQIRSSADRFEGAGRAFLERVRLGYLELAAADPQRWVVVDGDAPVDEVSERVLDAVLRRLNPSDRLQRRRP